MWSAPGEVLVIPSNLPHKAEALEDTLDVDVFSPPRQDWLDGTDDYLRAEVAMDLGLRGKVALVAASSRGLGRAIAEELAAEGAALALCARGEEELQAAAGEIAARTGRDGDRGGRRPLDAPTRRAAWPTAALRDHGRVDILVTNAGGPPSGPFETHDEAAWLATVAPHAARASWR